MKIRNLALASFLLAAPVVPLPTAAAVCENGVCTESFQFTGSSQTWQVPAGVTRISFKIYGASGGRGGAGGEVRGELTSLPSTLLIYVGGQGTEGANAPGGYNGGGVLPALGDIAPGLDHGARYGVNYAGAVGTNEGEDPVLFSAHPPILFRRVGSLGKSQE